VVSTVRGLSPPWCGAELIQKIINKHHGHVDRTRQVVHQRATARTVRWRRVSSAGRHGPG
jgi:hypothetical protein